MSLNQSKLPKAGMPRGAAGKHEIHARYRDNHADPDGDRLKAPDYDIPMDAGRLPLTQDEMLELANCEVTIQKGLKTFYEVGEALMTIREKRLYRQSYDTFAEYCHARWDMSKTHANRLVGAAEVVANLTPMGVIPTSERQVRPLTQLKTPEEQQAAARLAVEISSNGRPTAAHYQQAVNAIKPQMTPPGPHPVSKFPEYAGQPAVKPPASEPMRYVGNTDDYRPDEGDTFTDDVPAKVVEIPDGVDFDGEIDLETGDTTLTTLYEGAMVKAASGHEGKLISLNGRIAIVETGNGKRPYDVENLTLVLPPVPVVETFDYKRDAKTTRTADETVSQPFDYCQTPGYALDPLFPYLGWSLPSTIWEPAAGEMMLVDALYDGGWKQENVVATDILTGQNFFEYEPEHFEIIVTNPPYSLKFKWLERCYQLGKPFALLLPVETLGAVTAQALMQQYGFEMMLLDSRVDFKMPNKGFEGSAQFPVFWLTWNLLPEKVMFGSISEGKRKFNNGTHE